jgi:ferritin
MPNVKNLLSPSMKKGLQKAIYLELYQSNLWKHTANQLQRLGYFGSQKYFLAESAEELTHYQILVDFINDMGDVAEVPKIDEAEDTIDSLATALQVAYDMELEVYNQYKKLYAEADEEDCAVGIFLQQFVTIQVKAVGAYGDLISRYNRCGTNEAAILEFDEYLSEQNNTYK